MPETSDAVITANSESGKIRGSLNLKYEPVKLNPEQNNTDQLTTVQPNAGGKATTTLGQGNGSINLTTDSGNIVMDKY